MRRIAELIAGAPYRSLCRTAPAKEAHIEICQELVKGQAPIIYADELLPTVETVGDAKRELIDAPSAMLPFPQLFVDAMDSSRRLNVGTCLLDPEQCSNWDLDDSTLMTMRRRFMDSSNFNPEMIDAAIAGPIILMFHYIHGQDRLDRVVGPYSTSMVILDPTSHKLILGKDGNPIIPHIILLDPAEVRTMAVEHSDVLVNSMLCASACAVRAVAMLNCSNVSLKEVGHTNQDIGARRARKERLAQIRYHVLTVKVGKQEREIRTLGQDSTGRPDPLRTVRGHYKTYDDKPLFGRFKGRFWWPPHVRGCAEDGAVTRDYELES